MGGRGWLGARWRLRRSVWSGVGPWFGVVDWLLDLAGKEGEVLRRRELVAGDGWERGVSCEVVNFGGLLYVTVYGKEYSAS